MNQDCIPSPPMRKRRVMKRPSVMETSKLEQKLDGIVTLLKSGSLGTPVVNASNTNNLLAYGQSSRDALENAGTAIDLSHHKHASTKQIHSLNVPDRFLTPISSSTFSTSDSTIAKFRHYPFTHLCSLVQKKASSI